MGIVHLRKKYNFSKSLNSWRGQGFDSACEFFYLDASLGFFRKGGISGGSIPYQGVLEGWTPKGVYTPSLLLPGRWILLKLISYLKKSFIVLTLFSLHVNTYMFLLVIKMFYLDTISLFLSLS